VDNKVHNWHLYNNITPVDSNVMKANKTLLVNSTKKQYMLIGMDYPNKLSYFLLKLEQFCNWDLRLDDIYVHYTNIIYYENVKDKLS
jgi:hypothetical protein